jgi:hypothetical protein
MQQAITNEINLDSGFYRTIKAEEIARSLSSDNVYFLSLFSSVREHLSGADVNNWLGAKDQNDPGEVSIQGAEKL